MNDPTALRGAPGSEPEDAAARERVRAALAEMGDRDRSRDRQIAEVTDRREAEAAERDAAQAAGARAFTQREREAEDAFRVTEDALFTAERAVRSAASRIQDFRDAHAVRRDAAHQALDDVLAGIPRALKREAAQLRQLLCDPGREVPPEYALSVADLAASAQRADEVAETLHAVVDGGEFSPLSTEERAERIAAAKRHEDAIKAAQREVRDQGKQVAEVLRQLRAGARDMPDPAQHAALALDANETAQRELHALAAALEIKPKKEARR